MKKIILVLMCLGIASLNLLGCQSNKTRVGEGAAIGGLLGAAAGGVIGNQSGSAGAGAGIGAAIGAIAGAAIGSQINKPGEGNQTAQGTQSTQAQAANPNQVSLQQIVELTKQGVHEDVIIDRIHITNSKYTLAPADIDYLKQNGVSQKVIATMQQG